ncbi:dTDP-4-dehydrorhamnose reductase [Streptomyces sp. ALB3]|uniref:dTDP-4-dehydrorhamnose reductase n=1 Tax=Streptomyces sp. ALB3 TaxID=3374278 RepID=UPI00379EF258
MNTVLVTGAQGMLGRAVATALHRAGHRTVLLGRNELDITSSEAVASVLACHRPRTVVNCAAYTAVDDAEEDEIAAWRINTLGPRHLAEAVARVRPTQTPARLIHISTDYVFDGEASRPYAENARTRPRTAYGRTKLGGERAVLVILPTTGTILRTAWLYGAYGHHFPATMARLAKEPGREVHVVADQYGQPTWTGDVAARAAELVVRPCPGLLHATNSGEATWFDLAREVFDRLGADPARLHPARTADVPRAARRPHRSTLGHERWSTAGLPPMRHWLEALDDAWPTLGLSN